MGGVNVRQSHPTWVGVCCQENEVPAPGSMQAEAGLPVSGLPQGDFRKELKWGKVGFV